MDEENATDYTRFGALTFNDFRKMALDPGLTCYEKIGFPTHYRIEKESFIFEDILSKLTHLQKRNQTIIDIGPGCSQLALMLIDFCRQQGHQLFLIDSEEMLSQLPNEPFITKIAGLYPLGCQTFLQAHRQKIDVILSYSVLHYIFQEANVFDFFDYSLDLLADEGQFLVGDIPNASKRKRFLSSTNGIKHHQKYYNPNSKPRVDYHKIEHKQINDSVLFGVLMRARQAGFDAYLMPQREDLPMANRREDLLITKP